MFLAVKAGNRLPSGAAVLAQRKTVRRCRTRVVAGDEAEFGRAILWVGSTAQRSACWSPPLSNARIRLELAAAGEQQNKQTPALLAKAGNANPPNRGDAAYRSSSVQYR